MRATTPELLYQVVANAFNSSDLERLMTLYERDAALVAQPGQVIAGMQQIRAAVEGFLALNGQFIVEIKDVVETGDLALACTRWSVAGSGPDGQPVNLRRDQHGRPAAAGRWRLALCDRPAVGRPDDWRMTDVPVPHRRQPAELGRGLPVSDNSGSETMNRATDEAQGLEGRMRGQLLRSGDAGYDEARTIWNAMIDRRPALIARCAGTADVVTAVNFAREEGLLVAVRGGGHNVAGNAICDGGLVIDLSPMKDIVVDPVARTARAGGGVLWGEFDRATQEHGLATTGGTVADTGIAGLTLGGGIGYLMRRFGLASDNLLSVEIVTADGQVRTASATEHADLFWGLRGGGGNFGVVTALEYRLHEVGPTVLGGVLIHPIERAREVFQLYREFAPRPTRRIHGLRRSADGRGRQPGGGPDRVLLRCARRGRTRPCAAAELRPPVADLIGPIPYTVMQGLFATAYPAGTAQLLEGELSR